jgi:hypothetical protein
VGLSSGQGSAPVALLSWSDDGGHTWSNEHEASMGAVGEYKTASSGGGSAWPGQGVSGRDE